MSKDKNKAKLSDDNLEKASGGAMVDIVNLDDKTIVTGVGVYKTFANNYDATKWVEENGHTVKPSYDDEEW